MNQNGALSVPMLAFLTVTAIAGFGSWGLLRHWRFLAEGQVRLDRCVGERALELRNVLKRVTASNERMKWQRRTALAAAITSPEAIALVRAALEAEFVFQEGSKKIWDAQRLRWRAPGACGSISAPGLQIADLDWERGPPDELGPQPFVLKEADFRIEAIRLGWNPMAAAARIQGDLNDPTHWEARWAALQPPGRPSTR